MKIIRIEAGSARYLSELEGFDKGLPHGVLNKVKTDVGGTFCTLNSTSNYIIVVPFVDLVESIMNDTNSPYETFGVYGGVTQKSFNDYLERSTVNKIAVTYDSLPKLISWLEQANMSLTDYKLLLDEYHLILEDMDYRFEAIDRMLSNITRFNHYTFLSATPIAFEFEIDFLKQLPHYEVVWNDFMKVRTIRGKSSNVYKSLVSLIESFDKGFTAQDMFGNQTKVEELYIYMNSVTGIKQVCDTLDLDPSDVKICCADRRRNKLLLGDYEIESVSNPNKRINFFTKKSFQGCNLFSNNGLVVIVSDARKEHTLIDVSTTMEQIVGRLRTNKDYQNVFSDVVVHLFSTNNKIQTDEEFDKMIEIKDTDANQLLTIQDKLSKDELSTLLPKLILEAEVLSIQNGKLIYNPLKKQSFVYKRALRKSYVDGLTIRNKFDESKKFITSNQRDFSAFEVLLSKAVKVSYKDLYEDYDTNYTNEVIRAEYELEYPEFADFKKYLTTKEMNTMRWVRERMIGAVNDYIEIDNILFNFGRKYKAQTISVAEINRQLGERFKEKGINIKPKATMLENSDLVSVSKTKISENNKRVNALKFN